MLDSEITLLLFHILIVMSLGKSEDQKVTELLEIALEIPYDGEASVDTDQVEY